jgi:glutamate decarboxylase
MALHRVKAVRHEKFEDVYTAYPAVEQLPKFRMPPNGADPRVISDLLKDELLLDGNARQNFATFCTTWMEDEMRSLMAASVDKNVIDKDEYPQTADIEERCVHMLADLWHADRGAEPIGCSTTGSSEAAMLGGLALKFRWRKKNPHARGKPNLVCGPVQICWEKFARYFDVELRQVPLQGTSNGLRPEDLARVCDEGTIGVVATLGVTFTGVYEPVAELAKALDDIQRTRGIDVPLHVDAASGGFVAPFIQPDLLWDFRIPRVQSINSSGHKFGLAPLGVGWALWRDRAALPEELIFDVDYLGGNMPTFALNFSRPGGQVIAQYYNFLRLGREGYARIQQTCADTAAWAGKRIKEFGPLELLYDGRGGLPAVTYKLKEPGAFTLYDVSERVRIRGWQIASYPLPANRQDTVVQRLLIRHGVSRDLVGLLLHDLDDALSYLKRNPPAHSTAKATYHH